MKTVLAVDFDGTLCKDGFPHPQGAVPNVNLFKELIAAQKHGAVIILWTCRGGQLLHEAVDYCKEQGLEFDYVNENDPDLMKAMDFDHEPRKIVATKYIDDAAIVPKWEEG